MNNPALGLTQVFHRRLRSTSRLLMTPLQRGKLSRIDSASPDAIALKGNVMRQA